MIFLFLPAKNLAQFCADEQIPCAGEADEQGKAEEGIQQVDA